jgi:hypothetical protein
MFVRNAWYVDACAGALGASPAKSASRAAG